MRINRESIGKTAFRCAAIAILLVFPALAQAQIRTVLVSPVPGDPVASGTALRNALIGIQSPSSSNPWLLKIEPGVYDVQGNPVAMRPWVSIEGSGIEATTIRGRVPALNPGLAGTVIGANNAELRNLTVEASGNGLNLTAMLNQNASPRVYRVRFVMQGDGVLTGMLNTGTGTAPILEEIEIRVTGGSFAIGLQYVATQTRSELHRSRIAVFGGAAQSAGIHLQNGNLYAIRDTVIETYFGVDASGIYVVSANTNPVQEISLTNVKIISSSSPQANYGIYCHEAVTVNVFTSQITAHNQFQANGIRQIQSAGPTSVLNSSIAASNGVVSSAGAVSISNSLLIGGPVTGSWKGCFGVLDEAGGFYTGPCPP